jgi:uncharacterized protein (DUF433 family)
MKPGTGIYTPREAAFLLGERPSTIRRCAWGYARPRSGQYIEYPPLIKTELPVVDGQRALTFVELVELLYIRAFERAGVPWTLIKHAAVLAARIFDTGHPFALRRLFVDPKPVYAELREHEGDDSLVQLVGHGQHTMPQLVKPYLDELDFDVNEVAQRWWPMGRRGGVVIDPRIAFGAPVVEETGIRAEALGDAYDAERPIFGDDGAVERVAWTYAIEPGHVRTALRFRDGLRKLAA